jgi:hypothetical protein
MPAYEVRTDVKACYFITRSRFDSAYLCSSYFGRNPESTLRHSLSSSPRFDHFLLSGLAKLLNLLPVPGLCVVLSYGVNALRRSARVISIRRRARNTARLSSIFFHKKLKLPGDRGYMCAPLFLPGIGRV